jgi:hypothetical protein
MPSKRRRIRGPWRRLYAAAFHDSKVYLLAKMLALPHTYAWGYVTALWAVVPPSGLLSPDKAEALEAQVFWHGAEGDLVAALVGIGLLDEVPQGLTLHNVREHGGSFAEAQRQADKRAREREAEEGAEEEASSRPPPKSAAERSRIYRLRRKGHTEEEIAAIMSPAGRHVTPSVTATVTRDDTNVTRDAAVTVRDASVTVRDVTIEGPQNGEYGANSDESSRRHVTVLSDIREEKSREDLIGGEIARAPTSLTIGELQTEMTNGMGLPGIPPRYAPALRKLEREGKLLRETVEYVWRDTSARKAVEGARPNVNYFCQALVNEASRAPVEAPAEVDGIVPLGHDPGGPPRGAQRVRGRREEMSGGMRCVQRGVVLAQAILATDRTK